MIKKNIDGIEVNYIQETKYKHMMIVYSFQSVLDENTYNERHMLPGLLEQHNWVYNNTESFHTHLDMLYGARFDTGVFQRGNLLSTQFMMRIINQKYVKDQGNLLSSAFEFLNNILYKPKMYRGLLTKKAIKDKLDETNDILKTIKQDKASLAYFNFMKHIKVKGIPTFYPYEERLNKVSQQTMTDVYHQMMDKDQLKIYVIGEFDESEVDQLIHEMADFRPESSRFELVKHINQTSAMGEVIERDDVSIARIYMAYQIHVKMDPLEETMMELLNIIIGGYSQSKLFRNVREELHLVYYIYSTYLTENDLFFVHFECEEEDTQQSIKAVEAIIKNIQSGDMTEDEVLRAKLHLIKNYQSMADNLSGLLKLNLTADLIENQPFDMNEKIQDIHAITLESLIKFSQTMTPYLIYQFMKEGSRNE